MKKIYALMAAALMSASLFASPAKAPTAADLSQYGDLSSDVVLALYFDEEVCNDIVLVGTYNGWSTDDVAALTRFESVTGFDGWYVAAFAWETGAAGKAVQLKSDGTFDWKYQTGDKDAWINQGGKDATIEPGYDGECNVSYPEAGAYIYEIAYWKLHNIPCVFVPKHKYTIVFYDPYCEDNPEFTPAIAGDHNGWAISPMSEGTYQGEFAWIVTVETEEGNAYKLLEATIGWDNEFEWYDAENDVWKKFGNSAFPVSEGDMTIVIDYSDTEKYQYPKCGAVEEDPEYTIVAVKVPAGAPAAGVEVIGTFDSWAGTAMELLNTGYWFAEIEAKPSDEFKFREANNWDNEIVYAANGEALQNIVFKNEWKDDSYKGVPCKMVELDFSGAEYVWKANWTEGIENVTLTEKAQKVVVDGVLYIVRDNKMFNVQGAQVR